MFNTLSTNQAVNELMADEYADWSYEAATALVEWIEDFEENQGEPIEFDPIGLRCEFSEYTATELVEEYSMTLEEVRQHTLVLDLGTLTNQSFVVQQF
tara:strand:+ start:1049 stop:1342 length:294 start_codon:yes stop_codon:yes gene_type:complete